MEALCTKLRQSSPNSSNAGAACDGGFTVLEMLVASAIGLVLLAITLSTFMTNRKLVSYDLQRTSVNQNLRSTMDIVGMNIRLAGENLASTFPAIEIIDGAGSDPDELILRRNLFDEVLKVCEDISSGTSDHLYFGIPGTDPGCIYADQSQNFATWSAHRTSEGGEAIAYIFDPTTELGEFFVFDNEVDDLSNVYLEVAPGNTWTNNYVVGQAAAYIVEEWRLSLVGDVLQLVENDDTGNPQNIMFGIQDFQVQAILSDDTVLDNFDITNDWTDLQALQVSLAATENASLQDIERELQARFFPRNVLSN